MRASSVRKVKANANNYTLRTHCWGEPDPDTRRAGKGRVAVSCEEGIGPGDELPAVDGSPDQRRIWLLLGHTAAALAG